MSAVNNRLNRILTAAAIVMVLIWARRFFSSSGSAGVSQAASSGTGLMTLVWISVAVVCLGYLLWRLLSALFWRKYFHDEKPPEEDDSED